MKNNRKNLTKYLILLLIILILVITSLFLFTRKENMQGDMGFIESEKTIQWGEVEREGDVSDTIIKNGFNLK